MKNLIAAIAFSAALAAGAAYAGTIENSFGNTLTVTTPEGAVFNYHFEPDGTFMAMGPSDAHFTGAWVIQGDQVCLTPQGQSQACYPNTDVHSVGDTWTMQGPSGPPSTLTITAGR